MQAIRAGQVDVDFGRGVIRLGNRKSDDARNVGDVRAVPLHSQLDARAYATAFVIGESAFVTGGSSDKDMWRYDAETDTWARKADYPGDCHTRNIAFSVDGKGFVGLGYSPESCRDLWEYDPDTDSWTEKAELPAKGRYSAAVYTRDGQSFVVGGVHQDTPERDGPEHRFDDWREYIPPVQ